MKISILFLLTATLINGANLSTDVGGCSKITNSIKRLGCYDNTAKKHNLSVKERTVSASGKNQWDISEKVDPISDNKIISFINTTKTAKGKFGGDIYLVARCSEGKNPEVYINWASYLGSEAVITARFNKEESQTFTWSLSTDSKASFYPYSMFDGKPILEKFIENNQFIVRVTPYSENPITAIFDLSGFTKSVKPYYKTCGLLTTEEKIAEAKKQEEQRLQKEAIAKEQKEQKEQCEKDGKYLVLVDSKYICTDEKNSGMSKGEFCEAHNGNWNWHNNQWNCD